MGIFLVRIDIERGKLVGIGFYQRLENNGRGLLVLMIWDIAKRGRARRVQNERQGHCHQSDI